MRALDTLRQLPVDLHGWTNSGGVGMRWGKQTGVRSEGALGLIQKVPRDGGKMVNREDQPHVVHWPQHGGCTAEENTGHEKLVIQVRQKEGPYVRLYE